MRLPQTPEPVPSLVVPHRFHNVPSASDFERLDAQVVNASGVRLVAEALAQALLERGGSGLSPVSALDLAFDRLLSHGLAGALRTRPLEGVTLPSSLSHFLRPPRPPHPPGHAAGPTAAAAPAAAIDLLATPDANGRHWLHPAAWSIRHELDLCVSSYSNFLNQEYTARNDRQSPLVHAFYGTCNILTLPCARALSLSLSLSLDEKKMSRMFLGTRRRRLRAFPERPTTRASAAASSHTSMRTAGLTIRSWRTAGSRRAKKRWPSKACAAMAASRRRASGPRGTTLPCDLGLPGAPPRRGRSRGATACGSWRGTAALSAVAQTATATRSARRATTGAGTVAKAPLPGRGAPAWTGLRDATRVQGPVIPK